MILGCMVFIKWLSNHYYIDIFGLNKIYSVSYFGFVYAKILIYDVKVNKKMGIDIICSINVSILQLSIPDLGPKAGKCAYCCKFSIRLKFCYVTLLRHASKCCKNGEIWKRDAIFFIITVR